MRVTLNGFYTAYPDLFDNLVLPNGLDKDMFVNYIIERSGMLFVWQQQPDYLKSNIGYWSQRNLDNWTKMYTALTSDYDPIENYNRQEEWTDTPDVSYTKTGGQHSESENKVSAFNSATYEPSSRSEGTLTYQNDTTRESGTRQHAGRVHGNIGVTTSQQMIQSELDLRNFNMYDYIARKFEKHFLVQIY